MSEKKTKLLVYLLLFITVFTLLFVQPVFITPVKFQLIESFTPVIRVVAFPFKEMKKILYYHRTFDEYMRLRKEVNTLKARLVGFDEVLIENIRLEKLLEFKRKLLYSSIAASVVGRDPSNWNSAVLIDKGTADGIAIGMSVVNALGVVGKVTEAGEHSAKVVLISDPSFSVTGLVKRSREVGLVSGTLQGLSRMRYLSSAADVQVGDQVITSKLSSSFPDGILIGKVIEVNSNQKSPALDCIIEPSVTLSQLEEVLVIQNH